MKVPLIFTGPGIRRGRSDAFAYLFDIFPTLADLAGTSGPRRPRRSDLAAVIRGESEGEPPCCLPCLPRRSAPDSPGGLELIRYPQINRFQLFNLKDDPAETRDLAVEPASASKIQELMSLLESEQKCQGDTLVYQFPAQERRGRRHVLPAPAVEQENAKAKAKRKNATKD